MAEWKTWQDDKEDFPYIIYHANQDGFVRPSHKALDGNVYSVDDPFIQTHMPGEWDYNCRCWGEQVTRKRAQREGAKTGGIQRPGKAIFDAKSGFMFNPANAFMPDASQLKDKGEVVQSMAKSVRHGKIRKMGMIVSSPAQQYRRADLAGLDKITEAMKKIQPLAQQSADAAGWDPKLQPGFIQQARKYDERPDKNKLQDDIKKAFPGEIELGKITKETCKEAGFGDEDIPITLDAGGKEDGLVHNWRHHKEGFVDPEEGERIIRATLGNPAAQVSVTFEQKGSGSHRIVSKIITFFDPKTKSYCVARYDAKTNKFRLVSWHRSPASYGEGEWEIKGKPQEELDENGNSVTVTDKDRRKEYWRSQRQK